MVKAIPLSTRVLAWIFVTVVALLLLAPLVVIIGVSFSESQFIAFPPKHLSLHWYHVILTSEDYLASAATSFQVAVLVTLSSTLIGGAAAIALHRRQLPWSNVIAMLFLSPLILPSIIFGIGMLMLWSSTFGVVSPVTLWISHTVIAMPYVIRTTLAVLEESDPFLDAAARTMGANRLQRLWLVVIPQCVAGLGAGAFFAFNISFDEAVLSLFLRRPGMVTLPVQIYGQLEFSPDPSVAAVSTVMIVLTIAMIVLIDKLLGIQRFARN